MVVDGNNGSVVGAGVGVGDGGGGVGVGVRVALVMVAAWCCWRCLWVRREVVPRGDIEAQGTDTGGVFISAGLGVPFDHLHSATTRPFSKRTAGDRKGEGGSE